MATARIGLRIEPLDVLFFRDGRPFEAGMRATGVLPQPQTLAGALRTHVWREWLDFSAPPNVKDWREEEGAPEWARRCGVPDWAAQMRIAGPWLYLPDGKCIGRGEEAPLQGGPLVPVPADIVRMGKAAEGGGIARLRPMPEKAAWPPGWHPPPGGHGMRPLWLRRHESFETARGFLGLKGLRSYLAGDDPDAGQIVGSDALYEFEDRTGIKVEPNRLSAADHHLYSVRLLRLRRGVSFYAEVKFGDAAPSDAASRLEGVLAWGGEGRRVQVVLSDPVVWPDVKTGGERILALLVTPGIFQHSEPAWNWKPDRLGLPAMVAAAVPGAVPISGWDLARRRPKPTRHAVPAGSVYCFQGVLPAAEDGMPFVNLAQPDPSLAGLGYGLALRGVWNYGD
jgi:CRISPR-associated protein Cmr3